MSVMVFGQWFTDSLDGSLGKYRKQGLVKWGFFADHILDLAAANSVTPLDETRSMEFSAEFKTGGGYLVEERQQLLAVSERLRQIATADNSEMTRTELADLITDLVSSTEHAAVVAGRFIAFGENNTCSLTKGSKSMTPLLTSTCRVSRARARQLRRAGLASERFPHFHRAMMEGSITLDHIDVLQPVWRSVDSNEFTAAEPALAELAGLCTPEEFKDYLREWEASANPHQHLDEFVRAQAQQHLLLQYDLNGCLHLTGAIGPEHAEPFAQTVANRAAPLKAANPDRFRSATAMDALINLVLNPDGKYRAHLEVLVPNHNHQDRVTGLGVASLDTPTGPAGAVRVHRDRGFGARYSPRTARGTLVPPAIANQLTSSARVRHHQLDQQGTLTTDSPAGRRFTATQQRLIRLRDHRCQHSGCTTPAVRCETDHVKPWNQGGPTLIRNGQLLCPFHHHWKHRADPSPHRSSIFDDSPVQLE
jgi:hypothetical protein